MTSGPKRGMKDIQKVSPARSTGCCCGNKTDEMQPWAWMIARGIMSKRPSGGISRE